MHPRVKGKSPIMQNEAEQKNLQSTDLNQESCVNGISRAEFLKKLMGKAAVGALVVSTVHYQAFKPAPAKAANTMMGPN
ncbi:MAG: hypothetical protein K2X27_19280 [Candidatus Obscuribacterales bacterium]|nr:hypothetical protein [Candidatus Obscuribacterales bacterium]